MHTIAITGGKGGCGKTNVSANLAIALAQSGHRVTVFDADLGLANLDVILGVGTEHTLQDVLSGERTLSEILSPGPGGMQFIAGGSGVRSLLSVGPKKLNLFLSQVPNLAASTDILIFDTGAGVDPKVTAFLRASDSIMLVTTPDPACIIDSYATAKTLLHFLPDSVVRVVVNMVRNEAEATSVFDRLQSIITRFIGKDLTYSGHVRVDLGAQEHIRRRVPFVLGDPTLPASQDISLIAQNLAKSLREQKDAEMVNRIDQGIVNQPRSA